MRTTDGRVSLDIPIFTGEVFGPVLPVTVFDTDAEAIELAHATPHGLTAAISSADLARALSVREHLRTKAARINDASHATEADLPMAGWGTSLIGIAFGGSLVVDFFSKPWLTSYQQQPGAGDDTAGHDEGHSA